MALNILQLTFPIAFGVALVVVWKNVWQRRNTSANAWMVPFAYFSLVAWTLWVLQYVVLVAGPFGLIESDLSLTIGLWLAVMQNFLWITAILSLNSKHFSTVSLILPALVLIAIVIAPIIYVTPMVTVGPVFQIFDAVATAAIFFVLALSIWQLRVSKVYAVCFGITRIFSMDLEVSLFPSSYRDPGVAITALPLMACRASFYLDQAN